MVLQQPYRKKEEPEDIYSVFVSFKSDKYLIQITDKMSKKDFLDMLGRLREDKLTDDDKKRIVIKRIEESSRFTTLPNNNKTFYEVSDAMSNGTVGKPISKSTIMRKAPILGILGGAKNKKENIGKEE